MENQDTPKILYRVEADYQDNPEYKEYVVVGETEEFWIIRKKWMDGSLGREQKTRKFAKHPFAVESKEEALVSYAMRLRSWKRWNERRTLKCNKRIYNLLHLHKEFSCFDVM